jgi:hypothetical protein
VPTSPQWAFTLVYTNDFATLIETAKLNGIEPQAWLADPAGQPLADLPAALQLRAGR